jgi:Virulence factor BrkB
LVAPRYRRLRHYLARFADYNATYGSLGAGIGMMMWMWMWISSIVILFGAQLNSEIEHQTARGSTVRSAKPLGARGAVMTDTVGKAQVAATDHRTDTRRRQGQEPQGSYCHRPFESPQERQEGSSAKTVAVRQGCRLVVFQLLGLHGCVTAPRASN